MGAASVRITAADFVTPPEFHGLTLAGESAGRVGGVRLELLRAGGKTALGRCYQQVPLRVLPPFALPGETAALLYLLNPTAGLLDGDAHLIEIDAAPGSRAVVTGQSANRIHPAVAGFSTQRWNLRLHGDACLVVLPGPAIPYRACRYYQHAEIELDEGARLIWGDVWLPGRYGRDESECFVFDRLVQRVEVRRRGELVYRERFCWRGPWENDERGWLFGDSLASGTLFVTGGAVVPRQSGTEFASLTTAAGDTCLRWCGPPREVIRAVVTAALTLAGAWTQGPPWLGSTQLAGNHWFSPEPS